MDAIKKTGYEKEVKIGMDVAASEFLLPSGKYFNLLLYICICFALLILQTHYLFMVLHVKIYDSSV